MGVEDDVRNVAHAELDPIVPLQSLALDPFAIDESSMLAALIHYAELSVLRGNQGVVAGDARIGDDQVLIDLSAHRERSVVKVDVALVVPLHENESGKNPRTRGRNRACDGWISHLAGLLSLVLREPTPADKEFDLRFPGPDCSDTRERVHQKLKRPRDPARRAPLAHCQKPGKPLPAL